MKLVPYVVLWLVVTGLQCAVVYQLLAGQRIPLALLALVVFQALKVPAAAARLNDLGAQPDDAMMLLVPLANFGLVSQLLGATPSEAQRERRRTGWIGEIAAGRALLEGAKAIAKAPGVVVLLAVGAAGLVTAVDFGVSAQLQTIQQLSPDERSSGIAVLAAAAGFLGVYLVLQIFKRGRASRASWVPVFLLPSVVLVLLVFVVVQSGGAGDDTVVRALLVNAWTLLWACVGEAALVAVWVTLAARHVRGEPAQGGSALNAMGRVFEVAGPHGGMTLAVQAGMQVIIPGIHYALQLAFVDAIAVLDPAEPTFARSSRLTRGIRRRLFKVFYAGFASVALTWVLVTIGVELAVNGAAYQGDLAKLAWNAVLSFFYLPPGGSEITPWSYLASGAIGVVIWAVVRAALAVIYLDRKRVLASK